MNRNTARLPRRLLQLAKTCTTHEGTLARKSMTTTVPLMVIGDVRVDGDLTVETGPLLVTGKVRCKKLWVGAEVVIGAALVTERGAVITGPKGSITVGSQRRDWDRPTPRIDIGSNETTVNLTERKLAELPDIFDELDKLEILVAHTNKLTDLPSSLGQAPNLRELFIQLNPLERVPPVVFACKKLEQLSIEGTPIPAIDPAIGKLTKLRSLSAGGGLETLPSQIGSLKRLYYLRVVDSPLRTLPPALAKLTALQILDVRDNRLTTIPDALLALPKLKEIYVSGNPLSKKERERIEARAPGKLRA